jgi:hypothetical protein
VLDLAHLDLNEISDWPTSSPSLPLDPQNGMFDMFRNKLAGDFCVFKYKK